VLPLPPSCACCHSARSVRSHCDSERHHPNVSHGTIEHGSILIKDGKIAEVGQSVKAPKDAQVIDAAGQFVIPGIIDCHSHIAAESINEGSVSVSSIVNMAEILNSEDVDIYRDLAAESPPRIFFTALPIPSAVRRWSSSCAGASPRQSFRLKARCPASSSPLAKTQTFEL